MDLKNEDKNSELTGSLSHQKNTTNKFMEEFSRRSMNIFTRFSCESDTFLLANSLLKLQKDCFKVNDSQLFLFVSLSR